jgi:hypothetical protein
MLSGSPYSQATYLVEIGNIAGRVTVTGKVITDTDPAFSKFMGAQLPKFKRWIERKGGSVCALSPEVRCPR